MLDLYLFIFIFILGNGQNPLQQFNIEQFKI